MAGQTEPIGEPLGELRLRLGRFGQVMMTGKAKLLRQLAPFVTASV
jgi:hypothetical protein